MQLGAYPESFTLAAAMPRKFIALLGPTNSGKTYEAMMALTGARTGVYLAPLRLLALENYERLAEHGLATSLVTGEERRLMPDATHVASTVEMANFRKPVEVAVIDEVQMLDDPSRGAAWTAAICGIPASTVYLLGSENALPAIESLVRRLNASLTVRVLRRKTPLVMEAQALGSLKSLQKGDALIAFSRKDVLRWSEKVTQAGFSVATIYGNLSPEVRRAQAERFRDGRADIVVATDAIGMGLNLPVSRVIFTAAHKFDGELDAPLSVALSLQIAGRAGRFGFGDVGKVAGFDKRTHEAIAALLPLRPEPLKTREFPVAPSLDQLANISRVTGETRLHALLGLFVGSMDDTEDFFVPVIQEEQLERAQWLDALPLGLDYRFLLSLVPVSMKEGFARQSWEHWARKMSAGKPSALPTFEAPARKTALQSVEDACRVFSGYAWLGYRLPHLFPAGEQAVAQARKLSMEVDRILQERHSAADGYAVTKTKLKKKRASKEHRPA